MRLLPFMFVLIACGDPPPELVDVESCRDPEIWKPVSDTADPDAVYFGCAPPEGWRQQDSGTTGS